MNTLEKIDYRKLVLDRNNSTAFLTETGMEIDCGAIAKGYIADRGCGPAEGKGSKQRHNKSRGKYSYDRE